MAAATGQRLPSLCSPIVDFQPPAIPHLGTSCPTTPTAVPLGGVQHIKRTLLSLHPAHQPGDKGIPPSRGMLGNATTHARPGNLVDVHVGGTFAYLSGVGADNGTTAVALCRHR